MQTKLFHISMDTIGLLNPETLEKCLSEIGDRLAVIAKMIG